MSKVCREFDIEERLIDFAVHVIRTAESLPKKLEIVFPASLFVVGYHQLQIMVKPKTRLRNSTFPVRHSITPWCDSMAKDIIINDYFFVLHPQGIDFALPMERSCKGISISAISFTFWAES